MEEKQHQHDFWSLVVCVHFGLLLAAVLSCVRRLSIKSSLWRLAFSATSSRLPAEPCGSNVSRVSFALRASMAYALSAVVWNFNPWVACQSLVDSSSPSFHTAAKVPSKSGFNSLFSPFCSSCFCGSGSQALS